MKAIDMIKLATKGIKPSEIKKINEKGIDTEQIIQLSDAGYSVNDIDDLINMIEDNPDDNPTDTADPGNDPGTPDKAPEDNKDKEHQSDDKNVTNDETEQLKKQLAAAQNMLASKDLSGAKVDSPEDKFKEALRNLI